MTAPAKPPEARAAAGSTARRATDVRHSTRQERSRRTADAIVSAARALLSERDFDAVSVADVAARAEVSVGGVYARFPDKAAIAVAVDVSLMQDAHRAIVRAMGEQALAGLPAQGVIEAYVRTMVRFFARHRRVMRTLALRVRGDERHAVQDDVREFSQKMHRLLCERLSARRAEISHPDPDRATEFGIMMVSAAAREVVLFGAARMNLSTTAGRELVQESTRAFCQYLGVPFVDPP